MARRPIDISPQLKLARETTSDGELVAALLVAYRARPLTAVAELIEAAGRKAGREYRTKSLSDEQACWLEVCDRHDPADLDWLIANVVTSRGALSKERMLRLKTWPIDPRLGSGLLALCDGTRLTSRSGRAFWAEAFRVIGKHADARMTPAIERLQAMAPVTEFGGILQNKVRALAARVAKLPVLTPLPTEQAELDALASRLELGKVRETKRTAEDFLREIWRAPQDDGPREVFADWLIEHGDARGELITLQLARTRGALDDKGARRERSLVLAHGRTWLGPLGPYVMADFRFERGFVHSAKVHWLKLAGAPAMMQHPAWATVREFAIHSDGERRCEAWIEHMIALGARRR